MRTHQKLSRWIRWAVPGAVLTTGMVQLSAQQPPVQQPAPTATTQPTVIAPTNPTADAHQADKTVAFEMRDKPWKSVLEWLSNETGLPVITTATPTGTFSYYGNTAKRRHTIPEVIDVLNEALLNQKFILILRDASFTIVPADVPIDPSILPRVRIEDLASRGNTEIVSVIVNLKNLVAEDVGPEVKKMMGPFGEYTALTRSNQLVLQDTVKSLRRVKDSLDTMEKSEKNGQNESLSHQCRFIKAREAEKILRDLLGDNASLIRNATAASQPQGNQGNRGGDGKAPAATSNVQLPKLRPFYITADERLNTVLVSGPPDKIAQSRDILTRIDVAQPGQQPIIVTAPILKTYPTAPGAADALSKTLSEYYKNSTSIRISPVGNSLMVLASADDHIDIARLIQGGDAKPNTFDSVLLSNLEAEKVATTLKGMFQSSDAKAATAPYIEADTNRNAINIKGTPEQVADIKLAIKAIGEGEGAASTNVRVITLDRGGSAAMAAELERLLNQMRNNPVRVVTPNPPSSDKPAPKEPGRGGPRPADDPAVLRDPQTPKPGSGKPITITAVGNKLIITSEDPEALKLANELARLLTSTSNEGDFEIIRLKNANATDAAKVIDEAFNGPRTQGGGQGGGGLPSFNPFGGRGGAFGLFGGGGAQPTPTTSSSSGSKVRVVADPASNSLLIKASPADMLSIRRLLKDAIDSSDENRLLTKTWVIGPLKHSRASQVADVIRDIYRDSMNSNNPAAGGGGRNMPFNPFGGPQQNQRITDASGNPRPAALTVSVEDQINSIIVHCSEGLYKDISKLVESLEGTAKGSPRSVKIVSIKGIDPEVLERAIDALHGNPATSNMNNRGNQGGPGGNRGFGGGGGGFGGNRGGGGGRGGNNGRFNRAPDRESGGGPANFERGAKEGLNPAGKDAGDNSILFDPATEPIQPVAFQDPPVQTPPAQRTGDDLRAPLGSVTVEPLRELGVIIMGAENKEDLAELERIIKIIQEKAKDAEIEFQLVHLRQGDATNVVSILNNLFSKVVVSSNGNVAVPMQTQQQTATTRTTTANNTFVQQTDAPSSVVMIPLPRFNAILLGTPKGRTKDVLREIERLDQPTSPLSRAFSFPLKKANATQVAGQIQAFYATRYNETDTQHQIRITSDGPSNTVFVQAAPADLAEIRELIERIDNNVSGVINDVRIIKLRNALSDELANTILQAVSQGVAAPTTTGAPGIVPRVNAAPGAPGGANRAPGAAGAGIAQVGATTKGTTLRFYSKPGSSVESGLLEDVHITSEPRSNSLIVAAPPRTMELINALVRDLDVVSTARSEMKIFSLKKADAQATAVLLQQLFLGGAAAAPRTGGGAPGLTGPTAAGPTSSGSRPLLSLTGQPADGATLIDLKISVDDRTNSIIVAGSRNDLEVIEAVISRLEDADIQSRRNEVYRLHNAAAADVANSLQQFLTNTLTVLRNAQQLTAFQEIQRDVVIVPDPISNSLLISATPKYYDELMRMIAHLDELPPQVVIQVLVAQVSLNTNEEFGVEFGLQSPVLFQRSVLPTGTVVNTSAFPSFAATPTAAVPGFNFNNTGPLGNSTIIGQNIVGVQGLGNLGVGRVSPTSNFGGLVFSAASESFNLLIRALKAQGRIDVLSRPQVMTLDNQTAAVNIGQEIPIVTSTTITGNGLSQNNIERRNVGVLLKVTPRITPDGKVLMRVYPEISSVLSQTVPLGNGQFGTSLNVQQVETTVAAPDGETVVIGGLITTNDTKQENKIPGLGDLPYVGSAFRYRTQQRTKQELLVILTPHIVRCQADADRIMQDEAKRMDWVLGDVAKVHGRNNVGSFATPAPCNGAPMPPMNNMPNGMIPVDPNNPPPTMLPGPTILPPGQTMPPMVPPSSAMPVPVPLPPPAQDQSKAKPSSPLTPASYQMPPANAAPPATLQPPQSPSNPWKKAAPAAGDKKPPAKEEEKPWVFRKDF